jgi:hypothetical protein
VLLEIIVQALFNEDSLVIGFLLSLQVESQFRHDFVDSFSVSLVVVLDFRVIESC